MNTPVLNDNLRAATEALCNLLAKEDKVVASKAKIGLFFQNPEATKLFEEVNAYGEELRNKHLAGMPPTEEEISKFDALRENVRRIAVKISGFLNKDRWREYTSDQFAALEDIDALIKSATKIIKKVDGEEE